MKLFNRNEEEQKEKEQEQKITSKDVMKAESILRKYKEGKQRLEHKLIANEEFWKLRQWGYSENDEKNTPATAWLWSCIQSRYADVMDSFPTCNIKAKQQDDVGEAKALSSIVPVVLEENKFEKTYGEVSLYTLKQGGGVYGIFWDSTKHNGLGDISIKKIDFINLFWEPGITDIQKSRHIFNTELVDNDILEQKYPQCVGKLNAKKITLAKYLCDDKIDTSKKSVVVDWYYHTYQDGRKVLHYCKFVNDIVLYATENDTEPPIVGETTNQETGEIIKITGLPASERGLYDHSLYPFEVQSLYPIEGSLCGYGLTDIGRDSQIQIDKLNKAIMDNAEEGATPRYFAKLNSGINEEEFNDRSKKIVHVSGNLQDNIAAIETKYLNGMYVTVLNNKIEELKYVTANQDVNNGSVSSGVTSASGIAALQETAGKNARNTNKAFYLTYRNVVYQVIELIRQFYTIPRQFRIISDSLTEEYVMYSNANIVPQQQSTAGFDTGLRKPEFDIEVSAEKANPYKKMEQNDLALQFYNLGFFNPQLADQSLACLQMMDFPHKEDIIQKINKSYTLMAQLQQANQTILKLANRIDPNLASQMSQGMGIGQPFPEAENQQMANSELSGENPLVERARTRARNSTEAN